MTKIELKGGVRRLAWVDQAFLDLNRHAGAIAILWIAIGALLLLFSFFLGISVLPFDGRLADGNIIDGFTQPKDVGYAFALNVWAVSLVLLPALMFTLIRARSAMEQLAEKLAATGMVRRRNEPSKPYARADFLAAWRKHMGLSAAFGVCFALLAVAVMFHDFYDAVLRPLMAEEPIYEICPGLRFAADYPCNLFNAGIDLDWSISALYQDGSTNRAISGVFASVVYLTTPVVGGAIGFFSFFQFVFFGSFYSRPSLEAMGITILPAPNAENPTAGFELFTETFVRMSWCALIAVITLYTGQMQNIYWRVPEASSMVEFYQLGQLGSLTSLQAIWTFLTEDPAQMWAFERSELLKTRHAIFAVLLVPFAFVTPLIFAYFVLFDTAIQGKGLLQRTGSATAPDAQDKTDKISNVSAWQIVRTDLRSVWLLMIVVIAIASFIWTRFIFIVIILVGALLLEKALRLFTKPPKLAERPH